MNRRIISVFIAAAVMFSLTACALFMGTTQKYITALDKTEQAQSVQLKTECRVTLDLSKASEETKTKLGKFKEFTLNMDEAINEKDKKSLLNVFLSSGEMVLNAKLMEDGEKVYLKSSFTGDKYIALNNDELIGESLEKANECEEYSKLFDEFKMIWENAAKNEIIADEGNSIENTPDGDIKVTNLSLELTDEKAKAILKKFAEAYSKNENIKSITIKNALKYRNKYENEVNIDEADFKKKIEEWFEDLPKEVDKLNDKFTLGKLKLTAKLDKDLYIIDEILEGAVIIKGEGEVKINFKIHTTRWNINGDVKIDIPEINSKDIMDISEMMLNDSEFYKKYLKQGNGSFLDIIQKLQKNGLGASK